MNKRRCVSLIVFLLAMVVGAEIQAQGLTKTLRPGKRVRVQVSGESGSLLSGRTLAVGVDMLVLVVDMPRRAGLEAVRIDTLALSGLDTVWRRRSAAKIGAIVGGLVVGAGMFAVTAWACDFGAEGQGCDRWGAVAAGGLLGVAVGGLAGAGVGALIPRWEVVYARSRLSITPVVIPGVGVGVRLTF